MKLNLIATFACASVLVSQVVVSSADETYGVGEFSEFSLDFGCSSIVVSNHILWHTPTWSVDSIAIPAARRSSNFLCSLLPIE